MAALLFAFDKTSAQTVLAPSYQEVCRAGGHPKWTYGKEGTPVQYQPLFGCDQRFGARRDADERFVEKLQARGLEGTALSWELVRQGWKWIGVRKLPSALNRFNLAFEADPGNGDVYHGIAVVMTQTGQPGNIVDYWYTEAVTRETGQPGRFADYGQFLLQSGRLGEARPMLEKAIALEPFNVWTLMNLATLNFRQDRQTEACAFVTRVLNAAPPPGYPKDRFDRILEGWRDRRTEENCG
ncbi:tetratricopeptide repeat protein [Minwuia sp.]|uniref:tetratricopeptide repeat protein n=1 Tax=Minwuia sp. TaxID=2493630 RepID=UPI003A8F230F